MKLLVCGGRDFKDTNLAYEEIAKLDPDAIIQGKATGADSIAGLFAIEHGLPNIEVGANWDYYGNPAGPIRNQWMLDFCKPDLVLALPGGRGTRSMTIRARMAGVKVIEIDG